ncbi:MAG: DUF3696 domain-containing protein [Myxococcales bacterium]|nr:DUF3696 domain-containing protein [Myxococcales bacterium]
MTLLFGANNAGKSTILQALLYVLEVLRHGDADVDRTELGGTSIDLGGFLRLVHRHELGRTLAVRVEFDTPGSLNVFARKLPDPFEDIDDRVDTAWLELQVSAVEGTPPAVHGVLVGTRDDRRPALELRAVRPGSLREGDPILATLDLTHPLLSSCEDFVVEKLSDGAYDQDAGRITIAISRGARDSIVPALDEPVRVLLDGPQLSLMGTEVPERPQSVAAALIELLCTGVMRQLVGALQNALYIGPLRAIPSRGFLSESSRRTARWSDGLAAWDALLGDQEALVDETNSWLEKLGAGCSIAVQTLTDPSASAESISSSEATVRRLLLDVGTGAQVLPCEVGAGISQVVPIVVAALEPSRRKLALLEQPELHIHPALQVGLGDLFIAASSARQFLIETHSEHLVLRLLRRIRETHDGELPEGAPSLTPERLSIVYIENDADGVSSRQLRVDATGEFLDRWPKGFFEERNDELF